MRVVVVGLLLGASLAEAGPPDGYQCYPGKPKIGVGCSCPAEHATVRDGENIAICKRVPRPAIAPATTKLVLVAHDWKPVALPALPTSAMPRRKIEPPIVTSLTPPPPAPSKPAPVSPELQKQLDAAERAFEKTDLVAARTGYEQAIVLADRTNNARIASFARYKLGWVAWNEAKFLDAKKSWEDVVAKADPPLRKQALKDLTLAYVQLLPPDKVFDYFERLDKATALERVRDVADNYNSDGKGAQARIVYRDLVVRESDPARICEASMGALRASLQMRSREDIGLDVAAFAQVASSAQGQCKLDADELLGDLAWAWHSEMIKIRGDARDVIEVWKFALAVVSDPARRDAMQLNLGYALWMHAQSAGGARPADWVAAALALEHASPDVAVDAFDNAVRAARGTKQTIAPMTMSIIKGTLTKLGTARAKDLLATLR